MRRRAQGKATRDLHDGQKRYLFARSDDGELHRYVHLLSPRRFGKTEGFCRYAGDRAQRIQRYRGCMVYQQLSDAREIAWPIFDELSDRYGWDCKFNQNALSISFPETDGYIKLFGLDEKRRHRQVRGSKWHDAFVDEAQDFYSDLERLLIAMMPGLADYNGRLFMAGTPGDTESGYFYDVHSGREGTLHWHKVRGTSFQNPHTADALRKQVDELKRMNPDVESEPWFRREFYGEWVVDDRDLVVPLTAKQNYVYDWEPHPADHYVAGVDWGNKTAFLIACYNPELGPHVTYLEGQELQDATSFEIRDVLNAYRKRYDRPWRRLLIVTDPGGRANTVSQDLTKIHGIPLIHAEKINREGTVELMKADASVGLVKIYNRDNPQHPELNPLAVQWNQLVYVEKRGKREEGTPRDIHDCALYTRRYIHKHLFKPPQNGPPTIGSREYWRLEGKRMREQAQQRQRNQLRRSQSRRRR